MSKTIEQHEAEFHGRPKPAPAPAEKSVEQRLKDAGAQVSTYPNLNPDSRTTPFAGLCRDGSIILDLHSLTPDRAVATLEASRDNLPSKGELAAAHDREAAMREEIERLTNIIEQLKTRHNEQHAEILRQHEEIKRLRGSELALNKSREMWHTSSVENAAEIERLRGEIAEAADLLGQFKITEGNSSSVQTILAWLARNKTP